MPPVRRRTSSNRMNAQPPSSTYADENELPLGDSFHTTNPFASQSLLCHRCIRRSTGNSQSNPIILNDEEDNDDETGILQNGQPCPNCPIIRNVRQRTLGDDDENVDTYRFSGIAGLDLNLTPPNSPPPLLPETPLPTGFDSASPPPLPMGGPWIINHPLPLLSPTLPTGYSEISFANIIPMNGISIVMDHVSHHSVAPSFPIEDELVDDDDEPFELDTDNMTYEELLEIEDTVGVVSTGLTVDQIGQCMRRTTYRLRRNMSTDEQCCICLEHFRNRVAIGKLDNCDHMFHFKCIKDWLLRKNDCPICRRVALNP